MVADLIAARTISEAWLNALGYLQQHNRESFDLLVSIADPTSEHMDDMVVQNLDHLLRQKSYQDVATVRNTIFPVGIARSSTTRQELYERYVRLLPRLRWFRANQRGTYFERLINYAPSRDGSGLNQLERIITTLERELVRRGQQQGALAHIYEAQIFVPGRDNRPMGFPCMSSLSFHLDGSALRLSATYRNQYYIQKALGNFLGLAELQRFVANAVGLYQGPLSVHAFHAEIDPEIGMREVADLLRVLENARNAN